MRAVSVAMMVLWFGLTAAVKPMYAIHVACP